MISPRVAAGLAVVGQVVFTASWVVAGAVQGDGYSVVRHEISDLGALTAPHAWVVLVGQGLCGAATILFGLIFPRLLGAVRGATLAGALIALSPFGLDNLSDAFFRLDCRRADGCSVAQSTASGHAKVHVAVAGVTFLVLLVAPFVVARVLRGVEGWADLARPSLIAGVLLVVAIGATLGLGEDGGGLAQRAYALLGSGWLALLALRGLRASRP
jgi:hypothetical membrane protein